MQGVWAWRACYLRHYAGVSRRLISRSARLHTPQPPGDLRRTRNIGIIAHIDAVRIRLQQDGGLAYMT